MLFVEAVNCSLGQSAAVECVLHSVVAIVSCWNSCAGLVGMRMHADSALLFPLALNSRHLLHSCVMGI